MPASPPSPIRRSLLPFILLSVLFSVVAFPVAAQTPESTPTTDPAAEPTRLPVGFHIGHGDSIHVEAARRAGGQFATVVFNWANIEPEPGYIYWEAPDAAVRVAEFYGLDLIARLDQPPGWALDSSTPTPWNLDTYAAFARRVAERYGDRLGGIVIWNEPNLNIEWNGQPPDAAAYAEMLKAAYPAIKDIAPDLPVLLAGLSSTEGEGDWAINDLDYLQSLYDAGAKDYFDVLTAHTYGFGRPPADPPEKFRPNFRRLELLHEIMIANGDGDKPIWVTEMGWLTWTDNPEHEWQVVTPETQADYTLRAIDYARENYPWVERLGLWQLNTDGDDYGYGIWHGASNTTMTYQALVETCSGCEGAGSKKEVGSRGVSSSKQPKPDALGTSTVPTVEQTGANTRHASRPFATLRGHSPIPILASDVVIRLGDRGTLHPHWVHLYEGGRSFSPRWQGEFFLTPDQTDQAYDLLLETMQIDQSTNEVYVNGVDIGPLQARPRPDPTSTWTTQRLKLAPHLLRPGPNTLTIEVGPRNAARQYLGGRWENMQFRHIRLVEPEPLPPPLFSGWRAEPSPSGWSETNRLRADLAGELWLTGLRPGELWQVLPSPQPSPTEIQGRTSRPNEHHFETELTERPSPQPSGEETELTERPSPQPSGEETASRPRGRGSFASPPEATEGRIERGPENELTLQNQAANRPDLVFTDILPTPDGDLAATDQGLVWRPAGETEWQPVLDAPQSHAYVVRPANGYVYTGFEGDGLWQATSPLGPWQRTALTAAAVTDLVTIPYTLPDTLTAIDRIYATTAAEIFVNDGLDTAWQRLPLPALTAEAMDEAGESNADKYKPRLFRATDGRLVVRNQDRLWVQDEGAPTGWTLFGPEHLHGKLYSVINCCTPGETLVGTNDAGLWQLTSGGDWVRVGSGGTFSLTDGTELLQLGDTLYAAGDLGLFYASLQQDGEPSPQPSPFESGGFSSPPEGGLVQGWTGKQTFGAGDDSTPSSDGRKDRGGASGSQTKLSALEAGGPGGPGRELTWTKIDGLPATVSDLVIDPNEPKRWLAATPAGLYRSEDGGRTWQAVSPPWTVWDLALGPQGRLYVGRSHGLAWVDDLGRTPLEWQQADDMGKVYFLSVHPNPGEPALVWSGTWGNNIAASSDGGETIAPVHNGLETLSGLDLIWHPTPGQVTLATFEGLYRTDDGGQRWFKLPGPLAAQTVYGLLQTDDGAIWAGASDGLWVSRDYGGSWQRVEAVPPAAVIEVGQLDAPSPGLRVNPPRILAEQPPLVYAPQRWLWAGTEGAGLWLSKDNGGTWHFAGLPERTVYVVMFDPLAPGRLVAATDRGIFSVFAGE